MRKVFRKPAFAAVMLSATALAGCATYKPPQISYDANVPPLPAVPAAVTDDRPRPIHVPPAWTVARGGQTAGTATGRVENANAAARVQPRREGYYNSIQIYPWSEGALYQVYAAPGQITNISLEPGESLTGAGPIAAGDTARWVIGDTESGSGVTRRVHILVKTLLAMEAEGELQQPLVGAWLLALTGCRLGEIVKLKWTEMDRAGGCFRLEDSKEGASIRPVGKAAFDVLKDVGRAPDVRFVLRPVRTGEVFGGMPKGWLRIAERAQLPGVTPHTLRHSFASMAADLGYSEPTIAAMLGHSANTITSRYVHHLDAVLIAAADKVAGEIGRIMRGEKQAAEAAPSDEEMDLAA